VFERLEPRGRSYVGPSDRSDVGTLAGLARLELAPIFERAVGVDVDGLVEQLVFGATRQ
jgi:hypothetical protein